MIKCPAKSYFSFYLTVMTLSFMHAQSVSVAEDVLRYLGKSTPLEVKILQVKIKVPALQ